MAPRVVRYYCRSPSPHRISQSTVRNREPSLNTLLTRLPPPKKSFWQFAGLCMVALGLRVAGAIFFPTELPWTQIARATLDAGAVTLLLIGSSRLLRREGFPADALGLQLNWRHMKGFLLGVGGSIAIIGLLAAVFVVQVPIHWDRGILPLSHAALAAHTHFWTSFEEELIFRGYALLVLARYTGPRKAVWAMSLLFGLFHLPGMGFGMAAAKMIATTGVMSIVFSYSFLLTGTLWTTVGLHAAINISLHTLTGLDGAGKPSLWTPTFAPWPTSYDAGFWTTVTITGIVAFILSSKNGCTVFCTEFLEISEVREREALTGIHYQIQLSSSGQTTEVNWAEGTPDRASLTGGADVCRRTVISGPHRDYCSWTEKDKWDDIVIIANRA